MFDVEYIQIVWNWLLGTYFVSKPISAKVCLDVPGPDSYISSLLYITISGVLLKHNIVATSIWYRRTPA